MKTPAYSYLRVSGKGQIEGDGFPRQRQTVQKFAKSNRIEIIKEFRDEGVTGTVETFERKGLSELFVAVKADGVRLVLVERPDRMARKLMVSEIILGEFRKLGVKVISAESGTELTVEDDDPERTLIRQILGAVAQWDKSVIVQKLRAARIRIRASKGRCEGRKPYGYHEAEATLIASMREWRESGASFAAIAARLTERGISPRTPQRAGKPTRWHPTMVQRILGRKGNAPSKPQ